MTSRAAAAVVRALDDRQREATEDVERILAAALRVLQRVSPDAPRVSDIVAEAGVSNKAFYRYFAGKDDLMLAVMERGAAMVVSYLEHQMAKESTPKGKITRWISGALAQVADPELIGMSRALVVQMSDSDKRRLGEEEILAAMRELLVEPIRQLGSSDAQRDADAVFVCTVGTMRRYVNSTDQPGRKDINHLVGFCLRGLGLPEATS
ncbi:TetR/AcrR family transcriptional regulator [Mycolicibacterium sp. ELW1]|uniref:TetR/AcrR family transcriptional regulator n=1 Tax=Mycobacteriaceae TaxID=1762 RepID=UPI000E0736B7|nr:MULTISPECIES: TetR/AcrR family transcriptional regulator [Mycobacteriaceae]MCV7020902.1 TetR/AcrR family transcriptional regulator [Mycolicibacterium aichiense]QEN16655.1 TetR/AcrR family transcriptional regulator [Mycobacterium sp. ELW1]STZ25179.1 Transcriptional regulator, TetR family [Mycolicibacterium aichiense]